jgi:two-component sensor histidine kinase
MLRTISLPVRLAILVAGTTLPLIGFSGAIVYQHYSKDRQEAGDRVLNLTRGLQLVLDREMQGIVSGLTVLANSNSLMRGDFESFQRTAEAFTAQFPNHPAIVVGDASGHQVFNTTAGPTPNLPPRTTQPERGLAFKTKRPVFSGLFIGAVSNQPIVTVTVPVFRDGQVIYDLSFAPPLQIFQSIIDQQRPSNDWTISIFDHAGINFARAPNPSETIGKSASPTLLKVMFSGPEGQARTVSLEGIPLITAFVRSDLSGWIVASGIAEQTLTAPATRAAILTAFVGLSMLLIGLAFSVRMATRIARAESLHELLIDELNHRVKNTLATVQSVASQTFRNSLDKDARNKFDARLTSLGRAHNILSITKWDGASIKDVIFASLELFIDAKANGFVISGPSFQLSSRCVLMLSMALHELATNAVKYGALSKDGGCVVINWQIVPNSGGTRAALNWRESGGPVVKEPDGNGFGSVLIERGFAAQLGGSAKLNFNHDGVHCTLEFPIE